MNGSSNLHTVPENRPVPEPILHILEVVQSVASEQECPYIVVGATARDLLLFHVFGISGNRATLDVDFAIAVESWERFQRMRDALFATEEFALGEVEHRLYLQGTDTPIDLIPFGEIAEDDIIAWPPAKDTIMTVTGFSDALAAAIQVKVSTSLIVPVVSLAALAILKLFAWQDRPTTDKDVLDLHRVISKYGDSGNEDRLYDSDSPYMERFNYDLELAGAALAGEDGRILSSPSTLDKLHVLAATPNFIDALAERIRLARWQFQPEKLPHVRSVLAAYFDELLKLSDA